MPLRNRDLAAAPRNWGGGDDVWEGGSGETAAGDVEGHR